MDKTRFDILKNAQKKALGFGALVFLSACSSEKLVRLDELSILLDPKTATIKISDYCVQDGFNYSDFFAVPMSYHLSKAEIKKDFDRDGIINDLDINDILGINKFSSDTNGDGYSDLLIFRAGFDVESQKSLSFCADISTDTDLDGLTDCEEENITHTELDKWDTDGDRIPDHLEVLFGLSPKDGTDGDQNPAADGIGNREKIKLALPISEEATEGFKRLSLNYDIELTSPDCRNITVSNIALVDVSNGNLVNLYFIETQGSQQALRTIPLVIENLGTDSAGVYQYQYDQGNGALWSLQ